MPDALSFLFIVSSLVFIIAPGQDMILFAYRPHFLPPGSTKPMTTLLLPGTVSALRAFLVKGPIDYRAGILSTWRHSRPRSLTWSDRTSGGVLIGLVAILAFSERK